MQENKVLIFGGYGNFGKRISRSLAKSAIPIIIAGRNKEKAKMLAENLEKEFPKSDIKIAIFDVHNELADYLRLEQPLVAINTCGPFQDNNYQIVQDCLECGVNYIDLSDGHDFVCGIDRFDKHAKEQNILVVSGASTVPALSSAVIENYKNKFKNIDSIKFGINPGGKSEYGLATAKGVLSYLGKPIKSAAENGEKIYGWQDIYIQTYPEIGRRFMANCDIPDLELFPKIYNIKNVRFSAGMESVPLHLGMWLLSWLVRFGLPLKLENHAEFLLKIADFLNYFGSKQGGMHVIISGRDHQNHPKEIKWFIIAKNNEGAQIPCVPTIILAKKLFAGTLELKGAMPCVAMITLKEYLEELRDFDVKQVKFD